MNRLWTALLMVATVAVFGGVIYVLSHNTKVPEAGQTPGYTAPGPLPTSAASSSVAVPSNSGSSSAGSSSHSATTGSTGSSTATASTLIAFLGDDYTHGTGGSGGSKTFPALVAANLGVHEQSFYTDNGGYAKDGSNGKAYGDLVDAVIAAHPTIVVVSGGRNDRADDPSTLTSKAAAVFSALRAGLPHATIVAVAPWWGDSPHPSVLDQVATAVRDGVDAAGGTYLDLADPLYNHPDWMSDGADPNDDGYAAIAESLEPKLEALLPA